MMIFELIKSSNLAFDYNQINMLLTIELNTHQIDQTIYAIANTWFFNSIKRCPNEVNPLLNLLNKK